MAEITSTLLSMDEIEPIAAHLTRHSDEKKRHLADDMEANGQYHPIGVKDCGNPPTPGAKRYRLIYGHGRFGAARLLGWKQIAAKVYPPTTTDTQEEVFRLTENIHTTPLTDQQMYLSCRALLDLNPAWKRKDLAEHLHQEAYEVTRIMAADDAIASVREAFLDGKLSRYQVYTASKLPESKQPAWLEAELAGKRPKKPKGRAAGRNGTGKDAGKPPKVEVPLAGGGTLTIDGRALNTDSLDGVIDVLEAVLKSAREGKKENYRVATWQSIVRDHLVAKAAVKA
jgi:ParB-like chromosome segregation protein Spo0J